LLAAQEIETPVPAGAASANSACDGWKPWVPMLAMACALLPNARSAALRPVTPELSAAMAMTFPFSKKTPVYTAT
jgi:hypothetical protein